MLGSSDSIACTNIMLNTAVAESLKIYADRLEGAADFEKALHEMIQKTIKDHKRIIFNGNGYNEAWIREATQERGLSNYPTTPDCIPHILDEKNVQMLTSHGVYSVAELRSRCEILLENYCKTVTIEANTMADMAKKQILPAVQRYTVSLASGLSAKKAAIPTLECSYESGLITRLSALTDRMAERTQALENAVAELKGISDVPRQSAFIRDTIIPRMTVLREAADEAETLTAATFWPFPTYGELLFGVR